VIAMWFPNLIRLTISLKGNFFFFNFYVGSDSILGKSFLKWNDLGLMTFLVELRV